MEGAAGSAGRGDVGAAGTSLTRRPAARWSHPSRIFGMATVPGGRLFVGRTGGQVSVYDPRDGRAETTLQPAGSGIQADAGRESAVLAIACNGNSVFSSGQDCAIQQWDLDTLECARSMTGHRRLVTALSTMPGSDRWLFSVSHDCSVRMWDLESGLAVHSFKGHRDAVSSVESAYPWVYSGASGDIKVWSVDRRQCVATLSKAHRGTVWALYALPDKNLASAGSDGDLKIWSRPHRDAQCIHVLSNHKGQVRGITYFAGTLLTCGEDGNVVVYDSHSWRVKEVFKASGSTVTCMTLQNNQLCTGGLDKTVCRWDVSNLLSISQPTVAYVPLGDVDASAPGAARRRKSRCRRSGAAPAQYTESTFYSAQRKSALLRMSPHDAAYQYDALPINFLVERIHTKMDESGRVVELVLHVPFLLLFIFYILSRRQISDSYFITRSAIDAFVGAEIQRTAWCRTANGTSWFNHRGFPRPQCDKDHGVRKSPDTYAELSTWSGYGNWVMQVLMPTLWPTPTGNREGGGEDRRVPMWGAKYLLGSLRFRTLRVTNRSCEPYSRLLRSDLKQVIAKEGNQTPVSETIARLQSFYGSCYGSWSSGSRSTDSFACAEMMNPCPILEHLPGGFNATLHVRSQRGVSPQWADAWFDEVGFKHASSGDPPVGVGGTYTIGNMDDLAQMWPAGGHTVEIPFNATRDDAFDMAAILVDGGFADDVATRLVITEFMTYAPFLNHFTAYKLYAEVAAGGAWMPTSRFRNFQVFDGAWEWILYDVVILLFVLYFIWRFFFEWYLDYRAAHSVIRFLVVPWNVVEACNLICFLIFFSSRFAWYAISARYRAYIEIPYPGSAYPVHLDYILDSYTVEEASATVNVVLTFLKLLKFVSSSSDLNILMKTWRYCQAPALGVLFLLLWLVHTYAVAGVGAFGGAVLEFRSVEAGYSTVMRTILGDGIDYSSLQDEQRQVAAVYFWSLKILCDYIWLSFFIAILDTACGKIFQDNARCLPLDASLMKTLHDIQSGCSIQVVQERLRALRHRQTHADLLGKVRRRLINGWRNRLLTPEQIEMHEHRELLAHIFIPRAEYVECVQSGARDHITDDFLQRIWLDVSWEYHNKLLRESVGHRDHHVATRITVDHLKQKWQPHLSDLRGLQSTVDELAAEVALLKDAWKQGAEKCPSTPPSPPTQLRSDESRRQRLGPSPARSLQAEGWDSEPPQAADAQSLASSAAERAFDTASSVGTAVAIDRAYQVNAVYVERTELVDVITGMIRFLLATRPTGADTVRRLLEWARDQQHAARVRRRRRSVVAHR